MNTRNNIKISFDTPTYMIFGDTTKCVMTFTINMPPALEKVAELLVDKKYVHPMPRICRGYAKVHKKDEYDEKKGLKISMAKAEIAAYTTVSNWLVSVNNAMADYSEQVHCFLDKASRVIDHDDIYIQKF